MKTIRDLLKFRQRGRSDAASHRYWIAQRERRARAEAMQRLAEIEREIAAGRSVNANQHPNDGSEE